MTDDRDLAGLDPYDLMAVETGRLDRYFSTLDGTGWEKASRCEGWSVRDVLAHLASSEAYNRACLDGTVPDFLADLGARGATDLTTANELGVRAHDGHETAEMLELWRADIAANTKLIRDRDGGDIDTSVGPYPARWQAFHLAFELAVHADDVFVPITAGETVGRVEWMAKFGRFAVKEHHPDVSIETVADDVQIRDSDADIDVTIPEVEFVTAVAARLPVGVLDAEVAAFLSATP